MRGGVSLIVPVRNEAVPLRQTATALQQAVAGLPVEIIYVLNDTQDESGEIIAGVFGQGARIIRLQAPGKPGALRAGDEAASHQTRVYLDADVTLMPDTLHALLQPLWSGQADLVAPRIKADLSALSGIPLRIARVWADQLARREDAFMNCTAFSPAGLVQRGAWPDILADDDWARSRITPARRLIVQEATVRIEPPRDLAGWIKVRARWIRGRRQLQRQISTDPGYRRTSPRGALGDLIPYMAVRLLAEPVALWQTFSDADWSRDNSTRTRDQERGS